MSILAWIEEQKKLKLLNAPKYNHPASDKSKGLWTRCDSCGVIVYIKHLKKNKRVCFECGYHLQMNSEERIAHLIDAKTWRPFDENLSPCDPLEFWDQKPYIERLKISQQRTGLQDAVQTGTGLLDGIPVALGVMDFYFMGGSMGSVVGEKITRLIEYATQEGLTLILVCASGGARMQEGVFSLMQMAKISAALQIYQNCANLFYISIVTSPTTGGVTASFAMLGDLIVSEPKALIGFAGKRVIQQTLALQEELPEDFQTAEYVFNNGLLDLIIPRCFLKGAIFEILTFYKNAPLKRLGYIPHGVQQNLNCVTEEKIRRKWKNYKINNKNNTVKKESSSLQSSNTTGLSASSTKSSETKIYKTSTKSFDQIKINDSISENTFSEFEYRKILTSFQTMFNFFDFASNNMSQTKNKQNTQKLSRNFNSQKKTFSNTEKQAFMEPAKPKILFTEALFSKFIEKFSSKKISTINQTFNTNFSINSSYNEKTITNSTITPKSITYREILEWKMLYTLQNNLSKKNFLDNFINTKHKNFFYKSFI